MAKLDLMPDSATIIAMRKRVDFYLWKGIPVARKWPVYVPYIPSPAELTSRENFTWAAKATGAIDPGIQQAWKDQMTGGQGVTWCDWFRAAARGNTWIRRGDGS